MSHARSEQLNDLNNHLKSSEWLISEVNEVVNEFNNIDDLDCVDPQYLDDLHRRMAYLESKIIFENGVCDELMKKYGDEGNENGKR